MTSTLASYTKLKSGEWGIRVPGTATAGQTVNVVTKAGKSKTETIARVVWTGNGVSLCTVVQRGADAPTTAARGSRRGGNVCAECGRGGSLVADLEDGMMKHRNCCDIPPSGY